MAMRIGKEAGCWRTMHQILTAVGRGRVNHGIDMRRWREVPVGSSSTCRLIWGEPVRGRTTERDQLSCSRHIACLSIGGVAWSRRIAGWVASLWITSHRRPLCIGTPRARDLDRDLGMRRPGVACRRPFLVGVHAFGIGRRWYCARPWMWSMC